MKRSMVGVAAPICVGAILAMSWVSNAGALISTAHGECTTNASAFRVSYIASETSHRDQQPAKVAGSQIKFQQAKASCVVVTFVGAAGTQNAAMFLYPMIDGDGSKCHPNDLTFAEADEGSGRHRTAVYVCTGVGAGAHEMQMRFWSEVEGQIVNVTNWVVTLQYLK